MAFGALLLAFNAGPLSARRETAESADADAAIASIQAYAALYRDEAKAPDLGDKLAACWDLEAVALDIFGADLPKAGTPGRATVRDKLARIFTVSLADKEVRAAMARLKVPQACGVMIGEENAAVSIIITTEKKSILNLFKLRYAEKRWRITDQANASKSAQTGFVASFKKGYAASRTEATPDQFLDEVLKAAAQ